MVVKLHLRFDLSDPDERALHAAVTDALRGKELQLVAADPTPRPTSEKPKRKKAVKSEPAAAPAPAKTLTADGIPTAERMKEIDNEIAKLVPELIGPNNPAAADNKAKISLKLTRLDAKKISGLSPDKRVQMHTFLVALSEA